MDIPKLFNFWKKYIIRIRLLKINFQKLKYIITSLFQKIKIYYHKSIFENQTIYYRNSTSGRTNNYIQEIYYIHGLDINFDTNIRDAMASINVRRRLWMKESAALMLGVSKYKTTYEYSWWH